MSSSGEYAVAAGKACGDRGDQATYPVTVGPAMADLAAEDVGQLAAGIINAAMVR